ncbi:MAG: nucleoside/nucleotide kinase family protein [Lachnospiraceae bacterium]|nr:nucleoside/nucleotide kinase family protein [Lachnospiraceae bacterium]
MNFSAEINGIMVEAEYSDEDVKNRYLPFLERLTKMQKDKGGRVLAMIAAPPGCGKTTLLHFLKKLSEETPGVQPVTIIGMDGFHRYQDYLLTHTTERNGEEILMVKIKGAPETFDLPKLTEAIKKVAAGEKIGWPEYNRMTHNPQENAISVEGNIVLIEGNYLLLDEPGWKDLKQYADLTVRLVKDEEVLKKRLVERQHKSGKTYEEAEKFVEFSDMANVKLCMENSQEADIIWEV